MQKINFIHDFFVSTLRNLINNLIADENLLKGTPKFKSLYHYTTSEGLLGILENKYFHATHASYLNDSTEYVHGKNIFINVLKERLDKSNQLDQLKIEKLICSFDTVIPNNYYVICFSGHNDDLNQWIKYGDNANGYCLEFNYKDLNNYLAPHSNFLPIIYSNKTQLRVAKQLIDEIFEPQIGLLGTFGEDQDIFYTAFAETFGLFCLFFKSEKFKSEKEYRAIIDTNHFLNHQKEIMFYTRVDKTIVPYVKTKPIKFDNIDENLEKLDVVKIKRILIGAKQNEKSLVSCNLMVDKFLKYKIEVNKSAVTLV